MVRRAWRVVAAASLVAGALVVVANPAAATQFTVTSTADSGAGSLRQAVDDANANSGPDEIIFDPSIDTQVITLTSGELVVGDELTVTGNGATNTIIDGNGTDRIFNVSGAVPFTISGATLQHGAVTNADGGAISSDGLVTVDATTITDNSASFGSGGGVAAVDVAIQNGSVFRANGAGQSGGGALATNGAMTVTDSTIGGSSASDANTAVSIGGVGVRGGTGTVTITNSTVSHNSAIETVNGDAAVVVSGSTISSNTGTGVSSVGPLTITDSTISSNVGDKDGGGGAAAYGDATITRSWFDQNTIVESGGGGFGALGDDTTSISISDSTFSANQQADVAGVGAGGILLLDGDAILTNVTISGNTALAPAGSGAGGIMLLTFGGVPSLGAVTIGSSTIDGNSGGGIGVGTDAAAISVGTTILSSTTGPACDGVAPITDAGFNLLFNTTAGSCVFDAASDVTGADPELSALTLNAPATLVPTMALSAGSPALDAVTTGCPPPATDARGVTRPQGDACDIGAFELAVTPPPTTTTPTTTTPTVAPATGESVGSGATGTLPATGGPGPGPGLALLGATLLAVGALLELLELAPRRRA